MSLLVAAAVMMLGQAPAQRALIIGIDQYDAPRLPDGGVRPERFGISSLDGAANDARTMKALLISRYGFADAGVTLLLDTAATREAIVSGLRKLASQSKP